MKQKRKKESTFSGFGLLLIVVFLTMTSISSNAQDRIAGVVKDESGFPLPGVNVIQKETKKGVVTDFEGRYTISVTKGAKTLVFNYVGFSTKEVAIGGNKVINVTLKESTESLNEVVIIGYAAVERKKVLGSISGVKAESIEQATPVSALEGVQGKLSGVQILTNGGPGGGFDIRVRGVSTFGSGTNPLYVVDGQQLDDIDNLDPNSIESLEVLKDGATAAIYGSKAANGVVLITTKSGKKGEIKVDITSNTGYNSLVGDLRVSNTRQRILYEKLRQNNPANITGFERDSLGLLRRNSWDLQKLITRVAIRQQTNVALTSGSDKTRVYWDTGFIDQKGIILNSGYKRMSTIFKVDVNLSKKFTLGSKINLSYEDTNGINESSVLQQIVERIPYFPVFEPDGSYSPEIAGRRNPLAQTLLTNRNRDYRAQVFNYAQYEIAPKLTFKSTLGINYRSNKYNYFSPLITETQPNPPEGQERYSLTYDIQQENFINYRKSWKKHTTGAFAGMQIQKYGSEVFDIGSKFINEYIQTFGNADPATIGISTRTRNSTHSLYSLFAGFNYDYDGKYLISATMRRDGSSRFGTNNKFGNFPSASLGWKLSKENFLKDSNTVSNLLVRGSYGIVGNERIDDFDFTGTYAAGYNYGLLGGIAPSVLGNPDLKWEQTASANLGFDLGLFKDRLSLNVDLWKKVTSDLLYDVPLAEESGYTSIRKNVGNVDNKGIDIAVSATIFKTKNFSWNSSFNIAYQENKVTKLDKGVSFETGAYKVEEGQPIGNIFGYTNLGIYQYNESNAYAPDGTRLTPNFNDAGVFQNYTLNGAAYTGVVKKNTLGGAVLEGGDIIWEDLNNDNVITADDRKVLGNGIPKYYGGFSNEFKYKNLKLSFLFDYSLGQDIYRRWNEATNDLSSNNETPGPDYIEGSWRNPGDITVYPRLTRVAQNRNAPNSFFVTPGDYIKLRYVKFNYDFPKTFLKNIKGISSFSLNFAVNNVLTWTNYVGYNPELGNRGNALQPGLDNLRYPNNREFIVGLKVQLK
ncbi:SusC/RagA family TonB-linked outer membrane protein [Flavobacterium faecale]|uniref:SusC/RagA family TonB-linked outer membrane protein n=1 Tax=Flavobacterium faecale TaxID=1355330 RepID=UPI003AAD88E5